MDESKIIMKQYEALITCSFAVFPTNGTVEVSNEQGVYIIYSPQNEVLHVGTTKRGQGGLNQRLYNHLSGTSTFRKQYLKPNGISLRNGYKFKYIIINDARTRALLEALTAGLLCPVHFGTGEKRNSKA